VFHQVLAVMSHDIENASSQNAGIVMYRNIKDTIRTHFAETYGAGAFLEAPLHAYYGRKHTDAVCIFVTLFTLNYFVSHCNFVSCVVGSLYKVEFLRSRDIILVIIMIIV